MSTVEQTADGKKLTLISFFLKHAYHTVSIYENCMTSIFAKRNFFSDYFWKPVVGNFKLVGSNFSVKKREQIAIEYKKKQFEKKMYIFKPLYKNTVLDFFKE